MSGVRPVIMGKAMALNGDKTTTGATCIATIETVTCFNKKALRVGDPTTNCPKCGQPGIVISGQQGFLNHGKLQAVHGSIVSCGCPSGSNTVDVYKSDVESSPLKGNQFIKEKPTSGINNTPDTTRHHIRYLCTDDFGNPLCNCKYIMHNVNGNSYHGTTDNQGYTMSHTTSEKENISIHLLQ